jgi:crotonobetainyl-CoA:carnitine CoA-transferase CaiB-like acyl-CoA transferase
MPSVAPFRDAPAGALTGLRVVEVGGPLGEWCGRLLAGMGADVVKVEPPGGAASRSIGPFAGDDPGGDSLYFWHMNAGKRSVELDITTPDGRRTLERLVGVADVLVVALPLEETAALGLDAATLEVRYPRLVLCSISPFGPDGPYAGLATTDLIAMALGGPMQSCGYSPEDGDLPPVRPGQHHSYHTASHFAVTGILAALLEREVSGRGQAVEVAAHDCLSVTVEFANTHWYYAEQVVRRQTGRHAGVQPTARTQYLCADGRYVNLALPRAEGPWLALVAHLQSVGLGDGLDDPALLDPIARFAAGSRALEALEVFCATHTADEVFHLGQRIGLTWGAVRAPEDWLDDPHAAARGFFVAVEHPEQGRTLRYPGAPFIAPASPWAIRRRAPLPGEDTEAVLRELEQTLQSNESGSR